MTPPRSKAVDVPVADLTLGDDFRLDDDGDALADLAASIAELGVLQPLVVRRRGDGYEVVAGRRRLAASRIAGLDVVPCTVRNLTDDAALDITLAENLHRRQLSAVEEALAYAQLRDRGLTQTAIGARVGRSQKHVSTLLSVLQLPTELQDRVHRGEMAYTTALDRWGRKRFRKTGEHTGGKAKGQGALRGGDAELISHWRRRHDSVVAGVQAVLASFPTGDDRWRLLLDRVLKLDLQPFDEDAR